MAKYTATLTAQNTRTFICGAHQNRNLKNWLGTFVVWGTFGGGTVTWEMSPDGGTTFISLMDASGSPTTSSAADNFTTELGNGSTNSDDILLYASVATATNPSINIAVYDNIN